jgi:flagella basal body P-ring formation protein FlgA
MRMLPGLLIVATAAAALSAESDPSRVKLRAQATVYGPTATLADVLVLTEAGPELAQALEGKPVFTDGRSDAQRTVTHAQIVQRLDELGVNLARVLVSGAARCEVTLQTSPPAPPTGDVVLAADEQIIRTKPSRGAAAPLAAAVPGARTLGETLRAHLDNELKELGGQADLEFDRAGQEFIQLTSPPYEFDVSSTGGDKLGLREFRVVIRQDKRVQRTVQIFAHVRLTRPVVVAKRPLSIGNAIRPDDVAVETRVFDSTTGLGLGSVEQAIGQQVKKYVALGGLVGPDSIKSVDLVERARPVTILGAGTNVQVRLTGVALDAGGYGDTVRVRLGDTRTGRREVRGTVTALGTVRIAEPNP